MIIGPISTPATHFRGHFCARFDVEFSDWGIAQNGSIRDRAKDGEGAALSAYMRFAPGVKTVDVRIGVSFISTDQARRNLDKEIPDGTTLEETAEKTRDAWKEKLDRVVIEGASQEQKEIFYTAFYHTLQVRHFLVPWRSL
jgi:putative alpha-1,2-mannosidase